ncbi:MAG TPA: cellulase family glycosylhydrolase [Candidatus Paceibacterota bacterium]|nr:cellulase family glycosylhydrolase [Verrucomicrobiota bacterium]HRZ46306.1 cellulase family glycosylhydrolase [Candidatus Paceibacterota bacterium]
MTTDKNTSRRPSGRAPGRPAQARSIGRLRGALGTAAAIAGFAGWLGPAAVPAPAADLPEPVIPQGVGVNIHFTRGHERDLDMIAAAGFRFIRMDFSWQGTERKPGQYSWSDYDELTSQLERRGLRALYILDYSNSLYEETVDARNPITGQNRRDVASPRRPESVAAFARWAGAAAGHFRGHRIIWEIWNEPNISFWKPKPDVGQYTALALAACRAIRAADPQATIVAPATSEFPWEFLESFFAAGALDHLDAVSVHPYRDYKRPPETASDDYRRLRELIRRHQPPSDRRALPILSGEWGYATHTRGVSLETQAAFLVRQQLANLHDGVPLSIWYDWKNDGSDPGEREHNFGTVGTDLAPKPAYRALQVMTRELAGCRISRRVPLPDPADYVLVAETESGRQVLAAWTTGEARSVTFAFPAAGRAKGVTGAGESFDPVVRDGQITLALGPLPQYVRIEPAGLLPPTP